MVNDVRIAIMGGGNAGFAHAADLTLRGFEVRLFELPEMKETITKVKQKGGIESEPAPSTGLKSGFAKLHTITTDAGEALDGAHVVFIVVPAFAQEAFARALAPHMQEDQIVVLSPGNFGGSIVFAQGLKQHGAKAIPLLCEAQSMIYACRKSGPASIQIFGVKKGLRFAVFPAKHTARVIPTLQKLFPTIEAAPDALWTWLSNPNPVGHPPVMILNAGRIENTGGDFLFYVEGITPSVDLALKALDDERLRLGAALELDLIPQDEATKLWYGHQGYQGKSYPDKARNPVYASIKAESQLDSRYLTEDVPYGLVPWEDLAKQVDVDMPICTSLIELSNVLLGRDFRQSGRTLRNIGLGDMAIPEIKRLVVEGYEH